MSRGSDRRRWPVGYDPRRERRQSEAEVRQTAWDALTVPDRLASLRRRPGHSRREIRRLMEPSA